MRPLGLPQAFQIVVALPDFRQQTSVPENLPDFTKKPVLILGPLKIKISKRQVIKVYPALRTYINALHLNDFRKVCCGWNLKERLRSTSLRWCFLLQLSRFTRLAHRKGIHKQTSSGEYLNDIRDFCRSEF